MLDVMIALAAEHHMDQFDKGGKPYILHPIAVMMSLNTDDEELMQIAIAHDLVEDSEVTLDQLLGMGFSNRVVHGIGCLTHLKDEDYDTYLLRVCSNRDSIRVKLKDIEHNSLIIRMKGLREKDFARLAKYHRAYLKLKEALKQFKDR